MKQGILDLTKEFYRAYGPYVIKSRHFPRIEDGLKTVYRRIIYTAFTMPPNRMVKSAKLVGECMANYHPHGDDSIAGPISKMVKSGILSGQGNHGHYNISGERDRPAAIRYTEAMLSPGFRSMIEKLMPYVPMVKNDLGNLEPEYLPTPIPLCLMSGLQGIGFGTGTNIPAFDAKSLFKAYMANDPNLLEAPDGVQLVPERSTLKSIWKNGRGPITYRYEVGRDWNDGDGERVYVKGKVLFPNKTPDLSGLDEWDQWVWMRDESDEDADKLVYSTYSRVRKVSLDDIEEVLKESSHFHESFYTRVHDGETSFPIGIYDWIDRCYKNYLELINVYKKANTEKLRHQIEVWSQLPIIAEKFIESKCTLTDDELSIATDVPLGIVKEIMAKSINTLRSANVESKLESLNNRLEEFMDIDPVKFTDRKSVV